MQKLVVIGAGGLGREVAWVIERINSVRPTFELMGFLDDDSSLHDTTICGAKVLGSSDDIPEGASAICAVGNNRIRYDKTRNLIARGIRLATVIDPCASVAPSAKIGAGSYIGIGATVSVDTELGASTIVNHHACIGHDVKSDDACQFCPGCCISGNCRFGKRVLVATLSGTIPGKRAGDDAVIGAGVVAYRDLDEGTVLANLNGIRNTARQ